MIKVVFKLATVGINFVAKREIRAITALMNPGACKAPPQLST